MSRILKTILNVNSRNFKLSRCYSTNTSIKSQTEQAQQVYETQESVEDEAAKKPAAKMPLVKSFFIGAPDRDLLAYPEVIERDDMETFKLEITPIQNFFKTTEADCTTKVSSKDLQIAKDLDLFALNIPKDYEGKGYEWTQSLMASESETCHTDLAIRLLPHRMIIDILKNFGTEEQKQYFLPKMAKGQLIGSEAIIEPSLVEHNEFSSQLEHLLESKTWLLSGEKLEVRTKPLLEKDSKNLFLVLSANSEYGDSSKNLLSPTLSLVEGSEQMLQATNDDSQKQMVKFHNVKLEAKNIIGGPVNSMEVTETLLKSNRLRTALIALGLAQQIANATTQHFVYKNLSGVPLKDLEVSKIRMGKLFVNTYALESMIYYTSGLIDGFHKPDVMVEAAATKFFALNRLADMVTECNKFIGVHNSDVSRIIDAVQEKTKQLSTSSETMDALSFFIGMNGIQYSGVLMQDIITKTRNPLFNPKFIFSKLFEGNDMENPKMKLGLHENMHPSLLPCAQCLEQSLVRFQISVEVLLGRNGNEVVDRHEDIARLATIASELYAMWCSVSRASRSYCIGLQNADYELLAASTVCVTGRDKIKTLAYDIVNGQYLNNDNNYLRLSKFVSKSHGYNAAHPLSYNY